MSLMKQNKIAPNKTSTIMLIVRTRKAATHSKIVPTSILNFLNFIPGLSFTPPSITMTRDHASVGLCTGTTGR